MQEKILNSENKEKTAHEKLARHYLLKYSRELQVHFNLPDCVLGKILKRVAHDFKCETILQKILKNYKK